MMVFQKKLRFIDSGLNFLIVLCLATFCILFGIYVRTSSKLKSDLSIAEAIRDNFQKMPNDQYLNSIGLSDVYVINLERRKDRREYIAQQLENNFLRFTVFPAVDGKRLNETFESQDFRRMMRRIHPRTRFNFTRLKETAGSNYQHYGAIGCWQSHLQVYFEIVEKSIEMKIDKPVLILEDDAKLTKRFVQKLLNVMKELPEEWDVLFLGTLWGQCSSSISPQLCRMKWTAGAHAYIVNGAKAAEKLIGISNTIYPQVADLIWLPYLNGMLKCYMLKGNPLVIQHPQVRTGTDIQLELNVTKWKGKTKEWSD